MWIKAFTDGKEVIESLEERITGRYSCETIYDDSGEMIVKRNHMITPKRAAVSVFVTTTSRFFFVSLMAIVPPNSAIIQEESYDYAEACSENFCQEGDPGGWL